MAAREMSGVRLLGALVVLGFAAWLGVEVGDRSPPVTDAVVTITPTPIAQGDAFQLDVRVFYRRSCAVSVTRMLYDGRGERYALPKLELPAGDVGPQHSLTTITVSPNFAPGEGRYVSRPGYACNWFQRLFWPIPAPERTAPFFVKEAP